MTRFDAPDPEALLRPRTYPVIERDAGDGVFEADAGPLRDYRRTITFELTPDDLALWNTQMKRVVEPGTFTISAGPNSVDLKSTTLTVTG